MIHMIIGGSGSGKSLYAEQWMVSHREEKKSPLLYLATMEMRGEESKKQIERHRKQRAGKGFITLEKPRDLEGINLPETSGILLECVSNLVANELFLPDGQMKHPEAAAAKILAGIRYLSENTSLLVIVTNDVHGDLNGYSKETKRYIQSLGEVNQQLAQLADQITEVVYGIPVPWK